MSGTITKQSASALRALRMPLGRSVPSAPARAFMQAVQTSAGPSRTRATSVDALRLRSQSRSATTLASPTPDSRPPVMPIIPTPGAGQSSSTAVRGAGSSSGAGKGEAKGVPVQVIAPDIEAVKADEFFDDNTVLLDEEEARIVVTPEAVTQLAQITSREPPEVIKAGKLALRLSVDSGGCHGYQDTLSLTEDRNVDDYIFQPLNVHCIPIVIDLVSLNLLKGATLHYATELIGSSFRIQDNPQAKEGGACGCGVSWEAA